MARVLVTGGAGFIGSHVVERFLAAGHQVVVVDDLSTGNRDNLPAGCDLVVADVGSATVADLIQRGDFGIIAHLAAQMDVRRSVADPKFDATTNILGALNILEAARSLPAARWPRVIFASTGGALYGEQAAIPSAEETVASPDAPYGVAKLATELYLAYYARVWRMETIVLRFGNVYGPRQNVHGEAGVIAIFAGRIAEKKPLTIFGTGEQTRDFVYVDDVADAFFAASTRPVPPAGDVNARAFNIGTGVETSVVELARTMSSIAGLSPEIDFQPARPGEVPRSLLAVEKAERDLGWKAKIGLKEGLARTHAWVAEVASARLG